MSSELLASKIVIQEEGPRIRNIVGVPTAIAFAEGVAERGPVNVPTKITSFEEYVRIWGAFTANAQDLPLAVQSFFDEGGSQIYINRIVHYTDITNPATKTSASGIVTLLTAVLGATAGSIVSTGIPPFVFAPGDTLVIDVDAVGNATATFDAAPASVTGANTEPFALADGQTLTFDVNGSPRSVTFNTGEFVSIGAATAAEVAAVINAEAAGISATVSAGAVVITTDKRGTGATINNFGGTANATLGFTGLTDTGTGDVADIEAVTFAEIKTVVEADIVGSSGVLVTQEIGGQIRITSNTTGPTSSIRVDSSSTADTKVGFDNATHFGAAAGAQNTLQVDGKTDGAYANGIQIQVAAATNGVAADFNLIVIEDGNIAEQFPNVSMTDTATNYVETVINNAQTGSNLIRVTDLDAPLPTPDDRPANGTFTMTGGNDGLAGLVDTDFIGSSASGLGLRAADTINEIRTLTVPGRATSAVQNAMLTYAEVTRDKSMFAVLDPPASQTAAQMVTYVKTTAGLKESSEFGAIYWPRIKIANPNRTVFGNTNDIVVPPSGAIAGVYARNDAAQEGNVYEAPAGIEFGRLRTALGVETNEVNDEAKRDLVFPELINPIVNLEGQPVHIDGARTLKSTGPFPTIGERRGVIFIEQSLKNGLLFAKHRKIKSRLLAEESRAARTFLIIQTRLGAFASDDPNKAFFVDFSGGPTENGTLNNAATAQQRQTIGRIGLATAKPNEFIILRISQDQRALEQEIALAA